LDRGQVAASLRTLYKSGDYGNLRAVTTPMEAACNWTSSWKKPLLQSSELARADGAAERGFGCSGNADSAGRGYRKEKLDAAIVRLQDILKEEGLYQAKVTVETQVHEENHQIDVIVHVSPG